MTNQQDHPNDPRLDDVDSLIAFLEKYRGRLLIVDDNGNTDGLPFSAIRLWDDNDDAPLAIFVDELRIDSSDE